MMSYIPYDLELGISMVGLSWYKFYGDSFQLFWIHMSFMVASLN